MSIGHVVANTSIRNELHMTHGIQRGTTSSLIRNLQASTMAGRRMNLVSDLIGRKGKCAKR